MKTKRVAVVGSGLAGMTAALRLKQAGIEPVVFESKPHIGGRTNTVSKAGYTIDTAASAIGESYDAYLQLLKEIGLTPFLKPASNVFGVIRDGNIHELNTDALLISAFKTRLLSFSSKCRLLLGFFDVALAARRGQLSYADLERAAPLDFETAEEYALRRLNREIADYFCDPIVRAMQLANGADISKVEFFSGIANIFWLKLFGLEGGVNRTTKTIADRVETRLSATVTSLDTTTDGITLRWHDHDTGQHEEHFDGCVVACPFPAAAKLCDTGHPIHKLNRNFRYGQSITVAFGVTTKPHTRAYLCEVPRRVSEDIALLMLEHNKLEDAAPPGHGLIVAIWESNAAAAAMEGVSDSEVAERSRQFVESVMPEIRGTIAMEHVSRWQPALPYNSVGAFKAVAEFNAATRVHSIVQFAGDYTCAPGQNNAVESGNRAARLMVQSLATAQSDQHQP